MLHTYFMIITYSIHTVWLVITAVLQGANQHMENSADGMLTIISIGTTYFDHIQKEEVCVHKYVDHSSSLHM